MVHTYARQAIASSKWCEVVSKKAEFIVSLAKEVTAMCISMAGRATDLRMHIT